jgi:hypothetical protein
MSREFRALVVACAPALAVCLASSPRLTAVQPQAQQAAAAAPSPAEPWPSPEEIADRKREAERLRLFRSDAPIELTLSADFRAVQRDRNPESTRTFPATIEFADANGTPVSMPLQIRTRGHSRRASQTCTFAPLRLEFEKKLTKGTLFDGHGALKLGTHCRSGVEEMILREHAVYRMLNVLTPRSYRARLAKVTYLDTVRKQQVANEYGLIVEDVDDVAKRLEGRETTLERVIFGRVDPDTLNLMMLFEYMIGNTDFSIYVQHNVRLIQTPAGQRYPVPYDFDYSGLVDAPYAVPAKALGLTSVRDRRFRGPCRTAEEWAPYFDRFRAAKAELLALYDTLPGLSDRYRRAAKAYIEEFYRTISSPALIKREIVDRCEKVGM